MNQNIIKIVITTSILVAITGCGDDESAKIETTQTAPAPKIEVVKNDEAKAIKVEEKKLTGSKDHKDQYYYDYNVKSEYNANSKPANKDASVRTKPRTNVEANMNIRSPYEEVQISLMVKKLSKKFMVKCSACHNDYANGVIGPSLLGKSSDEIFGAIAKFKSGEKKNVLMSDLITMMSDTEIRVLADEIYQFNQQIEKARKK